MKFPTDQQPDNYPEILFESKAVIVCIKPAGILSEDSTEASMPQLLSGCLRAQGKACEIFAVHRLDCAVGGVMVYARTSGAAAELTRQIGDGCFEKSYLAVTHGCPEEPDGVLCDLLYHDASKNKTYTVSRMRRGVREAKLEYRLCAGIETSEHGKLSLVSVKLITGRTHQIRAQFSSRKMPLWGDAKYGSPVRGAGASPALWSAGVRFTDPDGGQERIIRHNPPDTFPWNAFKATPHSSDGAIAPSGFSSDNTKRRRQ